MFVGRKDILEDLESLWRKRTSSLVACRGRRRIGKSTLFREFARRSAEAYIEIEGLPPSEEKEMTNQDEIDHFMDSLALATTCSVRKTDRWLQAFAALDEQIDDRKRTVVLLDEISWMGRYDPLFPGVLWKAWETMFHRHERLIVVICGSVSSWIQKNILGSTGFAGRLSRNYVIPELSLAECVQFVSTHDRALDGRRGEGDAVALFKPCPTVFERVVKGVGSTNIGGKTRQSRSKAFIVKHFTVFVSAVCQRLRQRRLFKTCSGTLFIPPESLLYKLLQHLCYHTVTYIRRVKIVGGQFKRLVSSLFHKGQKHLCAVNYGQGVVSGDFLMRCRCPDSAVKKRVVQSYDAPDIAVRKQHPQKALVGAFKHSFCAVVHRKIHNNKLWIM